MALAQYDSSKVTAKDIQAIGTERTRYFDGIGKNVKSAKNLETAIALSGLNFKVEKFPIAYMTETRQKLTDGSEAIIKVPHEFPKQFATVRMDNMEPLGVVGKNYEILQNMEAFDFLDSMVGKAQYETAGSYGSAGAKSFITMSTEPMKILGDDFTPYILFMNSFDGSGSVRVMFTPIRVFCSNCLARALKTATNKVSIKHSSNLKGRLDAARLVLLENTKYLEAVKAEAEKMAITKFTAAEFKNLVKNMFVVDEKDSDVVKARNEVLINALLTAYDRPDLQNYNNTGYKAVQAFADYESHKPAFRTTATIAYKNIDAVRAEMPMTNQVADLIMARV